MQLLTRVVPTKRGDIWLRGEFNREAPDRPILLIIRGAFAKLSDWTILISVFRQADVVIADLPGINCPFFRESSVAEFAKAFDEAIESTYADRKVVVFGMSIGGLVAMSLHHPSITRVIACDPPLTTIDLWPMRPTLERYFDGETKNINGEDVTQDIQKWVKNIFGFTSIENENVDYTEILDQLTRPTTIIVASEPLEPRRQLASFPGLINAADRQRIFSKAGVTSFSSVGGHNVALHDKYTVAATINLALYEADRQDTVGAA